MSRSADEALVGQGAKADPGSFSTKEGKRHDLTPRLASTTLLMREGAAGPELFLVQRHSKSDFMAGAYVFPGGAVGERDHDPKWERLLADPGTLLRIDATPQERVAQAAHAGEGLAKSPEPFIAPAPLQDASLARAFAVAACRELFEEAGVLLASPQSSSDSESKASGVLAELSEAEHRRLREQVHSDPSAFVTLLASRGLQLDGAAMAYFAHWVTPSFERRRFDARFYLVLLPAGQQAVHDGQETVASRWASPEEILTKAAKGEWVLPPPTLRSVEELAAFDSAKQALASARQQAAGNLIEAILPKVAQTAEGPGVLLPWDPDYAQTEGAAFAPPETGQLAQHPAVSSRARSFPSRIVLCDGRWRSCSKARD